MVGEAVGRAGGDRIDSMVLWFKRLLPVFVIAVAVGIAWLMMSQPPHPPRQAKIHPSPNVDVVAAAFKPLQLYVKSQGTVAPRQQIEWASEVAGRVVWVSPAFLDGNRVAAGTVLLRLDDTEYRAAVADAESVLADARLALAEEQEETRRGAAYRVQQPDTASSSLRQPKLQQVEARVSAAEEQLQKARQDLARTEIAAPFNGVIDAKAVDLGQFVAGGTVLFNLLGTDVAEIRLPVTAGDIGFIDHAAMQSDTPPKVLLKAVLGSEDQQWQATLVRTEQRVDPELRTFYVVAEVPDPYNLDQPALHKTPLVLGMFVNARIEGRLVQEAMRLPRNAVHDDQFVYLVENGHLKRQDITIYRHEHDSVIVTRGFAAGDKIAITRLDLMVEGMDVTPVVDGNAALADAASAPVEAAQ